MGDYSRLAGILGASAVALGAFGAHGLRSRVTDERQLGAWQTAAMYHLIHSAVLLALTKKQQPAVACFVSGMGIFSGSLYAYGFTGEKTFGMIAPVGGMLLIAGWAALALRRS